MFIHAITWLGKKVTWLIQLYLVLSSDFSRARIRPQRRMGREERPDWAEGRIPAQEHLGISSRKISDNKLA
jgi:hypothetical protein